MNVLYITPAGQEDATFAPLRNQLPDLEWDVVAPGEDYEKDSGSSPALVVVSPEMADPASLARPLRRLGDAELLFLRSHEEGGALEAKLSMMPGIAGRAQVSQVSDPEQMVSTIRNIVQTIENRRQLRTTLDRMNLRLADSFDPAQMKKMALSDEYLAAILSSAADAIVSLDHVGAITSANDAAERMFDRSRRDLIRNRLEDFIAEEDRDEFLNFLSAADHERSDRLRLRFVRGDGALRTADVTLSWFGGTDKVPLSVSVIARDVSREERENLEKRLLADASAVLFSSLEMRESLQRLTSLLIEDWVDICLVDLFQEDRIRRVSEAAREDAGAGVLSLLPSWDVLDGSPEHPAAVAFREQKVILENGVDDAYLKRLGDDEERLAHLDALGISSLMIAPMVVHGRTMGLLTVISTGRELDDLDVRLGSELAQRTAIALDNARLYEETLEASRLKDEFLATLSHELRTPMTAILGWVRMLDLGDLDEETYREAMATIRRSAKAQASLIDDILDVSRITLGKLRLNISQVNPEEVISTAVETSAAAAQAKGIELSVEIEPDVPFVRGDASRLQQVIWNLLSNAVKFTPKRGSISVRCDTTNSWIRIRVSDTGEGIPKSDVPYVFDRFRQVDSSSTRLHGGLGLGLSIVKQIIELHGGQVTAESEGVGKGATFTVLLPIASVAESSPGAPGEDSAPEAASEEMALYSLEGQSILIVDDHDDARMLIKTVLEQAGALVVAAGSAREALEELDRQKFSVIVSDIAMPDEDGFRLLRKIRTHEEERAHSMCVVALTAFGGISIGEKMRAAGFDAYLRKPIDPVALTRTIHDLLQLDRPGSGQKRTAEAGSS